MNIELKPFQEKAIELLKIDIMRNLDSSEHKLGLKSPTGSGKTIIIAETLKRLVGEVGEQDESIQLCFVWIAINKLHIQSKDKLNQYYEDTGILNCVDWSDIDDDIPKNNILFFNWSSINKKDINKINKEGESQYSLEQVITNTKGQGKHIILIIDESHHTASTEKSSDLIKIIDPNVILKMSATLDANTVDTPIIVKPEDVVEEEMIKILIKINNVEEAEKHDWSDRDVIDMALKKRKKLKRGYEEEDVEINPLLLIQIPNIGNTITCECIEDILLESEITKDNGKLGVYLSGEDKEHLENIHENDNEIEVLIFKQAIATGWDCPRASILALFREPHDVEFSTQTIGRIMRMPEFKHYRKVPELNYGYVYTNLENIEIVEKVSENKNTERFTSIKKPNSDDVCLVSEHIERNNAATSLDSRFHALFETSMDKVLQKNEITKTITPINKSIIIKDIDRIDKSSIIKANTSVYVNDDELASFYYEKFMKDMTGKFATVRSAVVINHAVVKFFKNKHKITDLDEVVNLTVIHNNNRSLFTKVIEEAVDEYDEIAKSQEKVPRTIECWNIPKTVEYTSNHEERIFSKSIMKPVYVNTTPNHGTELKFMKFLEGNENVDWWFKNGENQEKYFAIIYDDENGKKHKFYVDFIVKNMKGKIWLLETKEGTTLKEISTHHKSNRLIEYLSDKKDIMGGIVKYNEGQNVWSYHTAPNYNSDIIANWDGLTFQ